MVVIRKIIVTGGTRIKDIKVDSDSRYHVKLNYYTNRPDIIRKAEFWTDASGIDDAKSIAMQKFTTASNIIINESHD